MVELWGVWRFLGGINKIGNNFIYFFIGDWVSKGVVDTLT